MSPTKVPLWLVGQEGQSCNAACAARDGRCVELAAWPDSTAAFAALLYGLAALEVPGIEGLEITIPLGHTVVPLPEGNRYLGFLFARAETPDHVENALRAAHARIEVRIEEA